MKEYYSDLRSKSLKVLPIFISIKKKIIPTVVKTTRHSSCCYCIPISAGNNWSLQRITIQNTSGIFKSLLDCSVGYTVWSARCHIRSKSRLGDYSGMTSRKWVISSKYLHFQIFLLGIYFCMFYRTLLLLCELTKQP